jgi:hypothetical protein
MLIAEHAPHDRSFALNGRFPIAVKQMILIGYRVIEGVRVIFRHRFRYLHDYYGSY